MGPSGTPVLRGKWNDPSKMGPVQSHGTEGNRVPEMQ
jgi:hypothetical protein